MQNRKLSKRGAVTSAGDQDRGRRHITARHAGVAVVALGTALTGAAIIAPSASAATSCVSQDFSEAADSGVSLQCVKDIQGLLNGLRQHNFKGPNQILTVDGYYGSHTDSDVRAFQSYWALGVDGITGPKTWDALCAFTYQTIGSTSYWSNAGCTSQQHP